MPNIFRMGCLLVFSLAAACAEKTDVGVNLHGVNYGGDAFSFYIKDPADPESSGAGGGIIDPFAAGGTTCCVTLPKKWRPGIKVQVHTTHWLPQKPDGGLPEVKKIHLVDVPAYADGKPGEIWVLRGGDGSIDVISSDLQPDHPNWPGQVKGWPIPSLEYRRERWELYRKHAAGFVDTYIELIDELEKSPDVRTREAWESASMYDRDEIKGFTGPDDSRYAIHLKKIYSEGLERSRQRLDGITRERP